MKAHEKEVIDMMYELFDEESMRKQLDAAKSKREFEKGEVRGKISVALNLLSLGTMSQEDIAKVTNLTIEKIRELSVKTSPAANI